MRSHVHFQFTIKKPWWYHNCASLQMQVLDQLLNWPLFYGCWFRFLLSPCPLRHLLSSSKNGFPVFHEFICKEECYIPWATCLWSNIDLVALFWRSAIIFMLCLYLKSRKYRAWLDSGHPFSIQACILDKRHPRLSPNETSTSKSTFIGKNQVLQQKTTPSDIGHDDLKSIMSIIRAKKCDEFISWGAGGAWRRRGWWGRSRRRWWSRRSACTWGER